MSPLRSRHRFCTREHHILDILGISLLLGFALVVFFPANFPLLHTIPKGTFRNKSYELTKADEQHQQHWRLRAETSSPIHREKPTAGHCPHFQIDPLNDDVEEDQTIDRANGVEEVALRGRAEQQAAKNWRVD